MTIDKKPVHSERVKLKHSSYRFRFNQHERRNFRTFCSSKARYKSPIDDNDEDGIYEDRNCWKQLNNEETNQNLFYNQSNTLDKGRTEINPAKCNFREKNITNNLQTIAYCFSKKYAKRTLLPLNLYSSNGCGIVSLSCSGNRARLYSVIKFLIICHILQVLPLLGKQETSKWVTNCQSINTISMPDDNKIHRVSGIESADHTVVLEHQINDRRYRNSFDRLLDEDLVLEDRGSIKGQSKDKNNENKLFEHRKRPLDFIKQEHHHHRHEKSRRKTHSSKDRIRRNHDGFYENLTADRPVVATRKGLIRGITQKASTGKFVDAFLGIPYAQPPIGKYRFRHPQPTNPWTGELDAGHMSNSCYQVNDTFFGANFLGTSIWNANTPLSEDCLYLNVWTPFGIANTTVPTPVSHNNPVSQINHQRVYKPPDQDTKLTTKRPVLVWIFGGGFYSGTSSLAIYEGGVLASEEDIIVVSMNYRVSALGFLYFGRPDAPGNAGLFDQLMALQWVNDNIDQFGGDPERVTIFGESAGAVSVAFHLLSPLSRNLFNQAILQSGAATCPWGFKDTREIIANGLQLASLVNCPSNNSDLNAVVECLLKSDPMSLVSQEVGQTKTVLNFPFVPVVDGSFLLEPPGESLIKSNFKRARILLGSNHDEGNAFLVYLPEFSQCPSSGSNDEIVNGNNRLQQTEHPSSDSLQLNGAEINGENGNMQTVRELRDSSGRSIESLESLTTSRQYSSTRQNAESEAQFSMTNSSDSKPCKPNDYPSLTRDEFFRVLKEDLNPYAEHPIGKEAIVFEYSNWNNPQDSVSNYDALDKIVGDYYFTCHVNELAHRYALAGNQVYMYYFKQRSSMSPWPKWMGVLHADEINFVFGEPLNQSLNYTSKEVELSKRMMRYWGNFAKYG